MSGGIISKTDNGGVRLAALFTASAAAAFLLTNVRIGGTFSPFLPAFISALHPLCAAAALVGGVCSAVAANAVWSCAAELSAAAVMTLYIWLFGKKSGIRLRSAVSGAVYFICAGAVNAGNGDWVLFAAVFFRAVMCAAAAYCMIRAGELVKNGGISAEKMSYVPGGAFCAGIVYMIAVAALCSKDMGILNPGRIAAGFCTAAAARKFGVRGGCAVGVLSASAFLLADQSLGRSGAMLAFSGLVAGLYCIKGKYAVNIAFICAAFGITAAAGMPSGTPQFIADMGAAAAAYCLIPERLYMPRLNGICVSGNGKENIREDRLKFAARVLEEVGSDVETASEMLSRRRDKGTESVEDFVKSRVCSTVCPQGGCSAFCGEGNAAGMQDAFRAAESIAQSKGSVTCAELPAGFNGCKAKARIADGCTCEVGIRQVQERKTAFVRRFLEGASEQLSASCDMILSLADGLEGDLREDFSLSEAAKKILVEEGLEVCSVQVAFDSQMRPFAEAYVYADKDMDGIFLSGAGEKLGLLLGYELAKPAVISCGSEERSLNRIRWRIEGTYVPDCRIAAHAAEGICGDSHGSFEDGRGNYYLILADGMGRGARAAAESSMAVSLLRRLILAGTGAEAAVRTLNVLMNAAASDETFTTADILETDLYTGRTRLIKMGGAPTLVVTREEGAAVSEMYAQCSAPLGIIASVDIREESFYLDENSRTVMMTDGIDAEDYSYITALLENDSLTCEQICDRIMAASDERERASEEKMRRSDDKTAAVLRLYRA